MVLGSDAITAIDAMIPIGGVGPELIIGARKTGQTMIAIDKIMAQDAWIEFMSELGRRHYRALSRIGTNFFDLRLVKTDPFLLGFNVPKYPTKIGIFIPTFPPFNLKVKNNN